MQGRFRRKQERPCFLVPSCCVAKKDERLAACKHPNSEMGCSMVKVFIGGSRVITNLPSSIAARIDNIIDSNFTVLVGDASGADKCVQKYLAERKYENVLVFCAGNRCRNNVGNWKTKTVSADANEKGFDFYALKDLQMAREANYGLMIWDAKSRGTLNNILNLLDENRNVLVFFSPDQSFHTIRNAQDLSALLVICGKQALAIFEEKLDMSKRLNRSRGTIQTAA